ncbi:MAG: hypothetical protein ICV73_07865 [Acetobacteraceae bacterium]|nr:hypothetical protein [Acetobacteraceae bacterium]
MADGTKGDDTAAGAPPPRDTYVPKPPSKEEVDQVSREQGMISDEWTGEPQTGDSKTGGGGAPRREG